MKKILPTVLTFVLITGFAACYSGDAQTTLEDIKWFLRSYGEQNYLISILEGTEITATFSSSEVEVRGSAGCNTYFAEYKADGDNLSVLSMASTEMACLSPKGIMEQEQEFLSTLANARSFRADGTTLTIYCSSGLQMYFTTVSI